MLSLSTSQCFGGWRMKELGDTCFMVKKTENRDV